MAFPRKVGVGFAKQPRAIWIDVKQPITQQVDDAHLPDAYPPDALPHVRTAGVDGMLVTFADTLSEPANRAALALRSAVERAGWDGVEETASSLVSVYVRFDPLHLDHAELHAQLAKLLSSRNWFDAPLPGGRRLWRIPTVFGTNLAPQLSEAATAAGLTEADAKTSLSQSRVRVQTIGFAPGLPYLGQLPPVWDIPRQSELTRRIPDGALAVAIRQLVLFPVSTPTGWRHVGQTAIRLFQPDASDPFILRPGDEVDFVDTTPEAHSNMRSDPLGGATFEVLE